MIATENYTILMEHGLVIFKAKPESPVIISIPHDGLPFQTLSGFFEPRKIGYRGRDLNVWPVAKDILLSARVNAVWGQMPRALVDYNRAWPVGINYYPLTQKEVHTALDDERLLKAYQEYHAAIDRFLISATEKFGRTKVLLVDLHGFNKQPPYAPKGGFDLILGTGNRASIHHGNIDEKLAKHLTDRGYQVFLPQDKHLGPEEDYFSADFTTRHHSEKHGVSVIQVEINSRFRMRDARALGQKLSLDLAEFFKNHCL
ncbi:MAG: N-formylglutamate amidohydrolase [Candidatus Paceibacterota bacterium]